MDSPVVTDYYFTPQQFDRELGIAIIQRVYQAFHRVPVEMLWEIRFRWCARDISKDLKRGDHRQEPRSTRLWGLMQLLQMHHLCGSMPLYGPSPYGVQTLVTHDFLTVGLLGWRARIADEAATAWECTPAQAIQMAANLIMENARDYPPFQRNGQRIGRIGGGAGTCL